MRSEPGTGVWSGIQYKSGIRYPLSMQEISHMVVVTVLAVVNRLCELNSGK